MKNVLGAFADGAILFPLLAALSLQGSLPIDRLLLTAGLAYIFSGMIFRIPMPVQPLKSIAIAAVAVHASGLEIRVSGAVLGLVCLVLAMSLKFEKIARWMESIPQFFIRGLQTALGVILAIQGIKILLPLSVAAKAASLATLVTLFFFSSQPLLGIFATLGLVVGVYLSAGGHAAVAPSLTSGDQDLLRASMVGALVIPQIALTFANSVLSTKVIAQEYFGEQAKLVTEKNLLNSIGVGNLISAAIGGLPYCHGAGGLTAHYRGGARHHYANYVIGTTLLIFALITHLGNAFALNYPLFLLASLLIAIGWFHFGLVRPRLKDRETLAFLVIGIVAAFTQTMTWPLVVSVLFCLPYRHFYRLLKGESHDFIR